MVQAPSAASISAITKRVPRERHMKVLRNLHTQHDILNCDVLLTDQNQSQQAGMFSCAWQSMYPQSCDLRRTVWSNSFQLIQNLVRNLDAAVCSLSCNSLCQMSFCIPTADQWDASQKFWFLICTKTHSARENDDIF